MGAAYAGYPFGITGHSHGKLEFSSYLLPSSPGFTETKWCTGTPSLSRTKMFGKKVCSLPDPDEFIWEDVSTPLLDVIENPIHLKNLSLKDLKRLADEIRLELSSLLGKGRKSAKVSLAVVDLTVAIHHVFHAPVDKILWDVGEQAYAHKILTGRRPLMHTMWQRNSLSGSTSRSESEYDPFGSGHGCNSVSAGLGMAVARDIKGKRECVVSVISNGTTMAGQVYEAMSNAGYLDSNMIVILNDSRHSLHPKTEEGSKTSINALSSTLSRLQSSKSFRRLREVAKGVTKSIGSGVHELAAKVDEYARGMIGPMGSTLFEELGMYYIGPVDGHNIDDLVTVLQQVSSMDSSGPVLVHVITEENLAEESNEKSRTVDLPVEGVLAYKLHNCLVHKLISRMDRIKRKFVEAQFSLCVLQLAESINFSSLSCGIKPRTYSEWFVEALVMEAERNKDIVAVHAGMQMESSLRLFQEKFPDKFFDVGMAEQHAVTFSAGLSAGGLKPFCIIPSTFLQRAYDQVIHDVDRQRIPVRFVITSAGLVGCPEQCGAFDVTFMSCLPNMIVMAPSDENELVDMVATSAQIDDQPVCFRYPRGAIVRPDKPLHKGIPIEIGRGRILAEGNDIALLGYGSMVQNCLKARVLLSKLGIEVTVADARFCKPLDMKLLRQLCKHHEFLITVEEGSVGGFGSHVAQLIALDGLLDGRTKWRPIVLPDNYIEHTSPTEQIALAGLTENHIAATALSLLGRPREALLMMC